MNKQCSLLLHDPKPRKLLCELAYWLGRYDANVAEHGAKSIDALLDLNKVNVFTPLAAAAELTCIRKDRAMLPHPRRYKRPVAVTVRLTSNTWAVIDLRTGLTCAEYRNPVAAQRLAVTLNEAANCR